MSSQGAALIWLPWHQFNFLWAKKLLRIYSHFTITFPTTWRCAGYFFKDLLKFKMAAMDELHNFLGAQKLKN